MLIGGKGRDNIDRFIKKWINFTNFSEVLDI